MSFIIFSIIGWILVIILLITISYYKKKGIFKPPARFKDWPPSLKILVILIFTCGFLVITDKPDVKDKDGFYGNSYPLNDPNSHGIPLLASPNQKAEIIRTINRFENYMKSGKNENGYVQVKMERDRAIGWLPEDIIHPKPSKTWESFKLGIVKTAEDFFKALNKMSSIIGIIFGLILAGLFNLIFRRDKAETYKRRIDFATVIIAASGAISAQIVIRNLAPFSHKVAAIEAAGARGCLLISYLLPTIISSGISDIIFGRCKKISAIGDFIFGLALFFMLYLAWGYIAAWWY